VRTYTIRRWLPRVPELWVARARPGDPFRFLGPRGGYAPVKAFIEVADHSEVQKLETPGDAEITWLPRERRPVGETLVAAVRRLAFPPGEVHPFVHGEANFVKELRAHLRRDRRVPLERLSISGYWRRGMDEDGWQSTSICGWALDRAGSARARARHRPDRTVAGAQGAGPATGRWPLDGMVKAVERGINRSGCH
jgi:NADPH-dependent ferric siderophore reductase